MKDLVKQTHDWATHSLPRKTAQNTKKGHKVSAVIAPKHPWNTFKRLLEKKVYDKILP